MFESVRTLFLYALSPVHFGAGSAIGPVDGPIQRETHTRWPKANSTSLRGPLRRWFAQQDGWSTESVKDAFGPESADGDLSQGSVGIGDAMVLLFPVRSARHAFVYATCPAVLSALRMRLEKITGEAQGAAVPNVPASPERGQCHHLSGGAVIENTIVLEVFSMVAHAQGNESDLQKWAGWIASKAFPVNPPYFTEKAKTDLVLLHDDDFGYFVRRSTVVEPHNRIDDATGTVAKGGLFYIENLPPETLLATWVGQLRPMPASDDKAKGNGAPTTWAGKMVLSLDGKVFQAGGDATTGRGLLHARFLTIPPPAGIIV